jgi:hypothetical protein
MSQMRRIGVLTVALFAISAALTVVAAGAFAKTPNPPYGAFAGCPSPEENPAVEECFTSTIKSGHFQMGSKNVPIENPITLSGGYDFNGTVSFNSKGGLTKAKQKVPGGVIGLTGLTWLAELLGINALTLYATTELAGTPGSPVNVPVTLPIKVHLENPVLGPNCYVGSTSNPIRLNLTTGTTSPPPPNKPITGVFPTFKLDESRPGVILAENGTFVDNSFSAPGASGCVLTLFGFIPISINGLVNSQSGLPAAAGTNETVQTIDTALVPSFLPYP